jgi:hypothetical protein
MKISTKLATTEAKQLFECIKLFDIVHSVIGIVEKDKRKYHKEIIKLYWHVNKIFIDYEKLTQTNVKHIVERF